MSESLLVAELREATGKGMARKLRAAGQVPAVLYGRGKPSTRLTLDPRALERLLHASEAGINTLIDLSITGEQGNGEERVVLVKEIQRDPVSGTPLHVDLYQVDLGATVEVEVPVHLRGRPIGVELHDGILDHSLRQLEISCLPRAIPEAIELDVSQLDVGDSIHVRDVVLPEGVVLRTDLDLSIASVVAARVAEEITPEAAVAAEAAPEAAPEAGQAPEPDEEDE